MPLQLTHHTKKEVFDWWEETTTGRVEWRYSTLEHGVLFQTPHGPVLMLQLCVDNCNILQKVKPQFRYKYSTECHHSAIKVSVSQRCKLTTATKMKSNLVDE